MGWEGLEQRLARAFSTGTDIDTTSDTENLKSVEPEGFSRTIFPFANDRDKAAKEARRHVDGPNDLSL